MVPLRAWFAKQKDDGTAEAETLQSHLEDRATNEILAEAEKTYCL